MLDDSLKLDQKFCAAENTAAYLLTQRFGIEFIVARESANGGVLTTLEQIALTGEVTRSGNPGYQLNQPLIVASAGSSTSSKTVSAIGTFIKGPDAKGGCLSSGGFGGLAKRLDFGRQSSASCHVSLATFERFVSFCQSETERASLEIFA